MPTHDPQHRSRSDLVGPQQPTIRWRMPLRVSGARVGAGGTLYVSHLVPTPSEADPRLVIPEIVTIRPDGTVQSRFNLPSRDADSFPAFPGRNDYIDLDVGLIDGNPFDFMLGSTGTLYVYDHASISAYEPSGTLLWTQRPGADPAAPIVDAEGTIYLAHTDRRGHETLAALGANGRRRWSVPTYSSYVKQVSVGTDGSVLVLTSDPGQVFAYDPADGHELPDVAADLHEVSSRVYHGGIVVGDDGTLFSMSDGNILRASGARTWATGRLPGWPNSIGAIGPDDTIIALSSEPSIFAVSSRGKPRWSWDFYPVNSFASAMVGADGIVYATGYWRGADPSFYPGQPRCDCVFASSRDGMLLWTIPGRGLALAERTLYVAKDDELIAVGP